MLCYLSGTAKGRRSARAVAGNLKASTGDAISRVRVAPFCARALVSFCVRVTNAADAARTEGRLRMSRQSAEGRNAHWSQIARLIAGGRSSALWKVGRREEKRFIAYRNLTDTTFAQTALIFKLTANPSANRAS